MERITVFDGEFWAHKNFPPVKDDTVDEFVDCVKELAARLAAYEETGLEPEEIERILDSYGRGMTLRTENAQRLEIIKEIPIDRLRELAQAYQLLGNTVYEPNKRGVISTYKVISVHFSGCSILVGWDLLDGIYSNLNGFEISALGKTVFLTREAAEAALKEREAEHDR
jgi:hypothetical protein